MGRKGRGERPWTRNRNDVEERAATPTAGRVLLVEDHREMREILESLLEAFEYQVSVTTTVASALELAADGSFDVAVCDIRLPDGSGLGLIRELKERHDLPAIVLSAYADERNRKRSEEAGAAAHLAKGTSMETIHETIQRIVRPVGRSP